MPQLSAAQFNGHPDLALPECELPFDTITALAESQGVVLILDDELGGNSADGFGIILDLSFDDAEELGAQLLAARQHHEHALS
jgi:hypothetical protein